MSNTINNAQFESINKLEQSILERITFFACPEDLTSKQVSQALFKAYLNKKISIAKKPEDVKQAKEYLATYELALTFKPPFEKFLADLSKEDVEDLQAGNLYNHVREKLKSLFNNFKPEQKEKMNTVFLFQWLDEYLTLEADELILTGEKAQTPQLDTSIAQEVQQDDAALERRGLTDLVNQSIEQNLQQNNTQIQNSVVQQNNVTNVIVKTDSVRKLSLEEKEYAYEKGILLIRKTKAVNAEITKLQKLLDNKVMSTMSFVFTGASGQVFDSNKEELVMFLHSQLLNYLISKAQEYKQEAEIYQVG
jgi:hypothetical protein